VAEFLAQLTPEWLTEVLRAHGHLMRGQVRHIEFLATSETLPARHTRFVVTYSPETPPTAPTQLFLKLTKPEYLAAAEHEIRFYKTLAPHMPALACVPWYGAGTVADTAYLLLADVSATHRAWANGPLPPTHLTAMVAALAGVHARWWECPELGALLGESPEAAVWDAFAQAGARYEELATRLGDQLTPEQRHIFERYLVHAPALFRERARGGSALTLCHPDNHGANFLFPQPRGSIYLIDWHVYRCWWGPGDIAALVTRALAPEQQHLGEALLREYHARLLAQGITAYPWAACWRDYRLGVIDTLRVVLSFRRYPQQALRYLTTIMAEFQRQQCAEILE
jgi:hypothetical protein